MPEKGTRVNIHEHAVENRSRVFFPSIPFMRYAKYVSKQVVEGETIL